MFKGASILFVNDDSFYIVEEVPGIYFTSECVTIPTDYDALQYLNKLQYEEWKFLLYEAVMNDRKLKEYAFKLLDITDRSKFTEFVRNLSEQEIVETIKDKRICFSHSFCYYLCYMLNDWEYENFTSREEREAYIF